MLASSACASFCAAVSIYDRSNTTLNIIYNFVCRSTRGVYMGFSHFMEVIS